MNEESQYTAKEMLTEVDNAIRHILIGGQSYKIGSRSLTRADLALLRSMKNDLTAQLAEEDNSGFIAGCSVAVFDGR
ncbi:MAG: peptidylprolyl isomerase [Oscillospiraceae bacterium]|jgi:hypothetical protein|nr:peptidylprolyl isomerase [Oscillospiraceae bacterium]